MGDVVPRGFLQVIATPSIPKLLSEQSGRKEQGAWLADPANPLPARVMTNRVWHWLLGAGLVRTTDNFGTTGELASHPELLEYLSSKFIEDGWSVKKLVRAIVLSRTYQLSTAGSSDAAAKDLDNRLLTHANRRRLDAEALRDAMLQVSGKLDLTSGGPSIKSYPGSDYNFKYTQTRRSVYVPVFRNAIPEILEVFDFADPSVTTGNRTTSTVAPQALFMLNHPMVKDQAKSAAERLLSETLQNDEARLIHAYRLTLGRTPNSGERTVFLKHLADAIDTKDRTNVWTQIYHALFASIDFRYLN
jgi:hypothetical protein